MNFPSTRPLADRRARWLRVLRCACRFLLAAVLLMAALTKITDLAGFEDRVVLHATLPPVLENALIAILPWLELTCGACLALGYARREAALIASVLLAAFIAHGIVNFSERDCGCFLFPDLLPLNQTWWQPTRNLVLLAASIVVWAERARTLAHGT
jgi:putative oxidoreductase